MGVNDLARPSAIALLVACLLVPAAVRAQTVAEPPARTFAGITAFVNPGDRVTITDKGGREVTGKVAVVGQTSVTLAVGDQPREFAADSVARIDRLHRQAIKGLTIGLVAGAAIGLIAGAASAGSSSNSASSGGDAFGAMVWSATAGGLWGAAIGALVPGHTTIYSAPAGVPAVVVTPHGGKVTFTFRF